MLRRLFKAIHIVVDVTLLIFVAGGGVGGAAGFSGALLGATFAASLLPKGRGFATDNCTVQNFAQGGTVAGGALGILFVFFILVWPKPKTQGDSASSTPEGLSPNSPALKGREDNTL